MKALRGPCGERNRSGTSEVDTGTCGGAWIGSRNGNVMGAKTREAKRLWDIGMERDRNSNISGFTGWPNGIWPFRVVGWTWIKESFQVAANVQIDVVVGLNDHPAFAGAVGGRLVRVFSCGRVRHIGGLFTGSRQEYAEHARQGE